MGLLSENNPLVGKTVCLSPKDIYTPSCYKDYYSQFGRMTSNDRSPSCFSLSGVRRSNGGPQFSNFREDKENQGPHDDEDEDGPILYREDDSMEEEGDTCSITLELDFS